MEENPTQPVVQQNLPQQPISPTPPSPQPTNRKFSLKIILGVILAFLIVGSATGYFVLESQTNNAIHKSNQAPTSITTPAPTPTIRNILSPNATEDGPTENWNQYINETFNYSFRYPNGWEVTGETDKNDQNLFTNEIKKVHGPTINFSTGIIGLGGGPCNTDPNFNLGSEELSVFGTKLSFYYKGDREEDTIGYADIGKFSTFCPGGNPVDVQHIGFVDKDGKRNGFDSISVSYGQPVTTNEFKSKNLEIAKKIISTFAIVNDPTANWKTYTSPDNTFSFKYPPDWILRTDQSVTLYLPETDFNFPAQGLHFQTSSEIFPETPPTPSINMTLYESVAVNGYYGRQTNDDKTKNPIGRVGSCSHMSFFYFPTSQGALEISACQPIEERYEKILSTIELYP